MFDIRISTEFKCSLPDFKGRAVLAEVTNSPTPPELWAEIETELDLLCQEYTTETIKTRSGIAATRAAYKTLGKDPSRYRPACEQLARRAIQKKGLYSVNTLVDLGNLVSLKFGYATGALDADLISGHITLGVGQADEPYEGIGRGKLNIEHLPVYRDELGGIATPTSDSVRTCLSIESRHLLLFINGYDGKEDILDAATTYTIDLLRKYAASPGNELVIAY